MLLLVPLPKLPLAVSSKKPPIPLKLEQRVHECPDEHELTGDLTFLDSGAKDELAGQDHTIVRMVEDSVNCSILLVKIPTLKSRIHTAISSRWNE